MLDETCNVLLSCVWFVICPRYSCFKHLQATTTNCQKKLSKQRWHSLQATPSDNVPALLTVPTVCRQKAISSLATMADSRTLRVSRLLCKSNINSRFSHNIFEDFTVEEFQTTTQSVAVCRVGRSKQDLGRHGHRQTTGCRCSSRDEVETGGNHSTLLWLQTFAKYWLLSTGSKISE